MCPICKELCTEPVLLNNDLKKPCQHSFCKSCIKRALDTKSECPVCKKRTYPGQLIPATALERHIVNLVISCPYKEKGCEKKVALGPEGKNYFAHATTCPLRGEPCGDCKDIVGWEVEAKKMHETVCQEKIIKCPSCATELLRKQLAAHGTECDEWLVECTYKSLGLESCRLSMKRRDYRKHCVEQMFQHLEAADKTRDDTEKKLATTKRKLEASEAEVKDLNEQIKRVRSMLRTEEERRKDYSNQCRWHITEWHTKSHFHSPKLMAGGILWQIAINKLKSACGECDMRRCAGFDLAEVELTPTMPLMCDYSLQVLFVGKYGDTVPWTPRDDESFDDDETHRGTICTRVLEKLLSEDNSFDIVVHFDRD